MRNAEIRCKNFICNLLNPETGNCTSECMEDITDNGFIIK